jgi:site-specific recombinase XerC
MCGMASLPWNAASRVTSRQSSRLSRRQVDNLFRKCAELAGINEHRAPPHILKHSYGTHLRKNGANPFYIMKALGHSCRVIQNLIIFEFSDRPVMVIAAVCRRF